MLGFSAPDLTGPYLKYLQQGWKLRERPHLWDQAGSAGGPMLCRCALHWSDGEGCQPLAHSFSGGAPVLAKKVAVAAIESVPGFCSIPVEESLYYSPLLLRANQCTQAGCGSPREAAVWLPEPSWLPLQIADRLLISRGNSIPFIRSLKQILMLPGPQIRDSRGPCEVFCIVRQEYYPVQHRRDGCNSRPDSRRLGGKAHTSPHGCGS